VNFKKIYGYMKIVTFQEEYNFLKTHLPDALYNNSDRSERGLFSEELIGNIDCDFQTNSTNKLYDVQPNIPSKPRVQNYKVRTEKFRDLYEYLFPADYDESIIHSKTLSSLIAQHGRKAFGTYLPMHSNFENKNYPWGIYLFPQIILSRAKELFEEVGKKMKLSLEDIKYAYSYAIFRHLLFHHQVEKFSTRHEILTYSINYKAYRKKVYQATLNTPECLEEALAEVSVLRSSHINNNIDLKKNEFQKLYKYDLKFMPHGNRDYECKIYDGIDNAQKYFASQIINCEKIINRPSTSICTVNAIENQIKIKKVPIYKVEFEIPERIQTPRDIISKV
jgi:hypothetical protein